MTNTPTPTLGMLLFDAARLLRRRFEQESRDIPMTSAQLHIVGKLSKTEGIGQAALAAYLDIEPMTLSRHIDRMETAGLVQRLPDPADRRARRLYTTELSRALLAPMRERATGIYEQVQTGLPPEARQALLDALETIIANLTESDRDADGSSDRDAPQKESA